MSADPWRARAACAGSDPEAFFPVNELDNRRPLLPIVRRVCAACPVRSACLEYALADPTLWGVWGGTSRTQRKAMRASSRRQSREKARQR